MKKRRSTIIFKEKELGHFVSKKRLFIKGSKLSERKIQRIEFLLRLLIGIGLVAVLVAVFVFVFVFLIPYLQSRVNQPSDESISELSSTVSFEPGISYDSMGLPILDDEINLRLINWQKTAKSDFTPKLSKVSGIHVETEIALALRTMLTAAKNAGHTIEFSHGFVSYEEQQELYDAKVEELVATGQTSVMAQTNAKKVVPAPGESDFQTGLCMRIDADPETFPNSEIYGWLDDHMTDYGFVFRFPSGKAAQTGKEADYTVIRYVGQKHAKTMRELSMCLEEYSAYLANR